MLLFFIYTPSKDPFYAVVQCSCFLMRPTTRACVHVTYACACVHAAYVRLCSCCIYVRLCSCCVLVPIFMLHIRVLVLMLHLRVLVVMLLKCACVHVVYGCLCSCCMHMRMIRNTSCIGTSIYLCLCHTCARKKITELMLFFLQINVKDHRYFQAFLTINIFLN